MKLILLALFVFVGAISGQTMMPVCRCSQLSTCMQQEMQRMGTCTMSSQCLSLLGGNRNQVTNCMNQKMQAGQSLATCLQMKFVNMACTNSTNSMQVRSSNPNPLNQLSLSGDRSALGQYFSCVQSCSQGTGGSGGQQSTSRGDCMQQLGCQLDMSMLDINAIVTGMQSCMVMVPVAMPMMNQQNSMPMPPLSVAMMMLRPQDCQCFMKAGVQISCAPM